MGGMAYSNGPSFSHNDGNSMGVGSEVSHEGTRPPSWWFTFPADPRWQV